MSDRRAVVRPTARVVVLDPSGRVLLRGARLTDAAVPPGDVLFRYPPGGGVESGEGVREAAARELAGGIGLVVDPGRLEGSVWSRRHVGSNAFVQVDSRETFLVLREVDASGRTELELPGAEPHRWWSAEEVAANTRPSLPASSPTCRRSCPAARGRGRRASSAGDVAQ